MREEQNLLPLLELILGVRISRFHFIEPQRTLKEGYASHGVRLDLYAQDEEGRLYNVEIQTSPKTKLPKRMRYYQSIIDISILSPGIDYDRLEMSCVIFICNYDPYDRGRYIYTFENRCLEEPDLVFGDETSKVIININGTRGSISEGLKELLDYLSERKVTGPYTQQLDQAIARVKASEERRHE